MDMEKKFKRVNYKCGEKFFNGAIKARDGLVKFFSVGKHKNK